MKNLHYFILIILIYSSSLLSQNKSPEYGVKAGIDFYKYTSVEGTLNTNQEFDNNVGGFLGGFINFNIANKINIQPEILFFLHIRNEIINEIHLTNPDVAGIIVGGGLDLKVTEQLVYIPILVQYEIDKSFYFEFGPQLGYSINKKLSIYKNTFTDPSLDNTEVVNYKYDRFDYGILFGSGYYFNNHLGIKLRYFLGLLKRDDLIKSSSLSLNLQFKI